MCFGGSEEKTSDQNVGGNPDMKTSVMPKLRPRTVTYPEIMNPAAEFQGDTGSDDYTTYQLKRAGYDPGGHKGVVDRYGNAVLDGNGKPVLSGTYANIEDKSSDNYQSSNDYNIARVSAVEKFKAAQAGATENISPALIAAGLGTSQFGLQDGYSLTNAEYGTAAATKEQQLAYTKMLASAMRDSYLGTNVRRFPEATFDDPLGTSLANTLNGTYLGSDFSMDQQRANFERLSSAYNRGPFRSKLEADAAGNVGTSTWGQRFGGGLANIIEGVVLGGVLGPIGSGLAVGTDYNTMDNYGTPVDGYGTGTTSTASFDMKNMIGGVAGDALAGYAAPKVGQAIYESTGSVGQATMGAVGTGIIASEQGGGAIGGMLSNAFGLSPKIMSSDIRQPFEQQQQPQEPEGGFGASLSDGQSNSSVAPQAPSVAPAVSTLDNSGLAATSTDVAAAPSDFDYQAWLLANAKRANPNSGQPVDLAGNSQNTSSNNPLFNAQPNLNGVRYLQGGGTNRTYGTASMAPVNSMQQRRSTRRAGLNDKRVGVIIG
tara:strand:- start:25400 stop:27025 length:1626 start_codon:yes stop_codon:yes gene_type:complete